MINVNLEWLAAMIKQHTPNYWSGLHIRVNPDGSGGLAGFHHGGSMGASPDYGYALRFSNQEDLDGLVARWQASKENINE